MDERVSDRDGVRDGAEPARPAASIGRASVPGMVIRPPVDPALDDVPPADQVAAPPLIPSPRADSPHTDSSRTDEPPSWISTFGRAAEDAPPIAPLPRRTAQIIEEAPWAGFEAPPRVAREEDQAPYRVRGTARVPTSARTDFAPGPVVEPAVARGFAPVADEVSADDWHPVGAPVADAESVAYVDWPSVARRDVAAEPDPIAEPVAVEPVAIEPVAVEPDVLAEADMLGGPDAMVGPVVAEAEAAEPYLIDQPYLIDEPYLMAGPDALAEPDQAAESDVVAKPELHPFDPDWVPYSFAEPPVIAQPPASVEPPAAAEFRTTDGSFGYADADAALDRVDEVASDRATESDALPDRIDDASITGGDSEDRPERDDSYGAWVHVARWDDAVSPDPVAEVVDDARRAPDAGDFLIADLGVADVNYGWPRAADPDRHDDRPEAPAPHSIDADRVDHDLVDDLFGLPSPVGNDAGDSDQASTGWPEPAGFNLFQSEPEPVPSAYWAEPSFEPPASAEAPPSAYWREPTPEPVPEPPAAQEPVPPPVPVIGRVRASARVPGLIIERPPFDSPLADPYPPAAARVTPPPVAPAVPPDMFVSARLSAVAESVSFAEPVHTAADVDPEILAPPSVTSDAYASLGDVADPADFAGPSVSSDAYASLGSVVAPADEDMDRPLAVPRALGVDLSADAQRPVAPFPPADMPYSNEDWRSTVRGSAPVLAGPSGTVYRGEPEEEAEVDEPISVPQRILRYAVVVVLLALFVVAFVYGPAIDQWFNN